MTSALYAPRIVCKICGSEENVTAVMGETYTTPTSVIQTFACNCSECLTAFRFEVASLPTYSRWKRRAHYLSTQ